MTPSIATDAAKARVSNLSKRWVSFVRRRGAFARSVLYPTLICAAYLFVFAADRWESESKITVKSSSTSESAGAAGLSLLLGAAPAVREDVMFLREFILSQDMLDHLNASIGLRAMYGKSGLDVFAGLSQQATREEAIRYYQRRVEATYDDITGVLTVKTQGFTPEDAKKINETILARSDHFLNGINQRIARDQIDFLDQQMGEATRRMVSARNAVIDFQRRHKLLDPVKQGEAGALLVSKLAEELVAAEAELRAVSQFLGDEAPQVVTLKAKIGSLRTQVAKEEAAITGGNAGALNGIAAQFQDLRTEAEMAREIYQVGLAEMEKSKINAVKKSKSLVVISSPYLPEDATLPNRPLWLTLFFIAAVFAFGVVRLSWISIRDHKA